MGKAARRGLARFGRRHFHAAGTPREEYGPRTEGEEVVKTTYARFDAADYLDNDEVIAEYLSAAVEDPDPDVFLAALGDVAKARGTRPAL
jgi:hypothetical protein